LKRTAELIDGFESPLGLELLGTVHWLLAHEGVRPEVADVMAALAAWPGGKTSSDRKLQLFDERLIELALGRLRPIELALA
jgi:hypothetical protein